MDPTPDILALVDASAEAFGVPASWIKAFCQQESRWDPNAKVVTGTDGARGGAYGLGQMTLKTAQGLGYTRDAEGLLDPQTNLLLVGQLLQELYARWGPRTTLQDVAAGYNSGHGYEFCEWLKDNATNPDGTPDVARRARFAHTVDVYVPNILKFEQEYAQEE